METEKEFKTNIRNILQTDADVQNLLKTVHEFKDAGGSQRDAYIFLQDIWLGYGFDDDDHDDINPLRDNLEYVMELVWGFCPEGRAVWGKSLSDKDFEEIQT